MGLSKTIFIIILLIQICDHMGLWPWLFTHPFTRRFWKSIKTDGWLQTYQRGHKAVQNTHTVGGNSERAKYVGMDQFGNKYYEDFDAVHHNERRWVEFNDYFSVRSPNGDRIPPKWHGWLAGTYDDIPSPDSTNFHDPFFEKPHEWNPSNSAFRIYTARQSIINPKALEYYRYRRNRYAKEWQPTTRRQLSA